FIRYVMWLTVLVVCLDKRRSLMRPASSASVIKIAIIFLTIGAAIQLTLHEQFDDILRELHESIMAPDRVDGVLTSISLGKVFASLTLRNPLELSFIGLALLVLTLGLDLHFGWSLLALAIVGAGRSNTCVLASSL